MAFDGIFLSKLILELKILENGRISKINHISKTDILLTIRSFSKNYKLLISSNPEYSRIHITNEDYELPSEPTSFVMLLRKHLDGGIIKSIKQYNSDRIVIIDILSTDEIGDKSIKSLIVEVTGRHSNIILTKNKIVIDAIKRIMPFENQYRSLYPSSNYEFPISNKKNPLINVDDEFDKASDITNKYEGISNVLANHIIQSNDSLESCINKDITPTLIEGKKVYFYFFDLNTYEGSRKHFNTLSNLLDYIYFNKSLKDGIKQKTSNLESFIKDKLTSLSNKLEKLNNDYKNASDNEIYKIKGELIQAYLNNIKQGQSSISVLNYYTNENIKIDLDPSITPIKNANKYFTKYQKLKKSIVHLDEQISNTINEIEYFSLLLSQIEISNINDALMIKEELENEGYIKSRAKPKKKEKIKILTYLLDDGSYVYVGKNNIQNDYITHKIAKSNDLWFHVKDSPSSHVVLRCNELTEYNIRTSSMICAYYSKFRLSSSIPIDYTYIKNLKKIPGKKNCFVTMSNQKTIYIDIIDDVINNLKKI